MLVLGLYCSRNLAQANIELLDRVWQLKGNLIASITSRNLEPSLHDIEEYKFKGQKILYIRASIEGRGDSSYRNAPARLLAHIILRSKSGLILVDTRGSIEIAEMLMDFLKDEMNIGIQRIEPSSAMWLNFLSHGHLIRATISTRFGFTEVSEKDSNVWKLLEEHPIITAQFSFDYQGSDYLLQLNEGFLIVHHQKSLEKLEHLSRKIEESLMDVDCIVNSIQ